MSTLKFEQNQNIKVEEDLIISQSHIRKILNK